MERFTTSRPVMLSQNAPNTIASLEVVHALREYFLASIPRFRQSGLPYAPVCHVALCVHI
jgi:hypothetical protein